MPSNLWGTIAILDYGTRPFVFEDEHKVPLGASFAIRRDLIERVGGFVPSLGRSTTRTMLGQELPELFRRARAAGARGLYVPAMDVFHHIHAARLTPSYCRQWWFGKGVSRARVDRMHPLTELGIDLRATPHLARVPRFMYADVARDLWRWAVAPRTMPSKWRTTANVRKSGMHSASTFEWPPTPASPPQVWTRSERRSGAQRIAWP
jgi:GT2 family glycosyltransferase